MHREFDGQWWGQAGGPGRQRLLTAFSITAVPLGGHYPQEGSFLASSFHPHVSRGFHKKTETVAYACYPRLLGDWGRRIAWVQGIQKKKSKGGIFFSRNINSDLPWVEGKFPLTVQRLSTTWEYNKYQESKTNHQKTKKPKKKKKQESLMI